ncbi:MAG: histidyl-tRNA synthetase [Candidatus Parcubacteria bacterium]|jgi:histidyl-tRNA synthetase
MIKITHTKHDDTTDVLKTAATVAEYFGFSPIGTISQNVEGTKVSQEAIEHVHSHERFFLPSVKIFSERARHLRNNHALTYEVHMKAASKKNPVAFTLHVAGVRRAIAEATLIATAQTILKEIGIEKTIVKMSSYGNTDSSNRYNRDLSQFLRKILGTATTQSITRDIQESPRKIFARFVIEKHPNAKQAPNPLDYLNDDARVHLAEVLEYLETTNIEYELDNRVVGSDHVFDQTVFEIHQVHEDGTTNPVAHGGRMNVLSRKAFRQHVDSTGIVITCETKGKLPKTISAQPQKKHSKMRFYFAHISNEAKRLTLTVLRSLYDARVPIGHILTQDTLTDQMVHAKDATHLVIIGHKEAVDRTVIVREVATRVQKVMPISQLASYLKKIRE